ncbi:MAG: aminodeoxychorismate/anthranilate synthase component II [Lutibacter sp.]|nr:aminodeoxychorismate/anthranilate synthase component II [Lutibacter sp.]
MKILIIDNYDSFTYNLVHMVEAITGRSPDVYRNDEISLAAIDAYEMIILSPGPGLPEEAGSLKQVIRTYAAKKPIFGVCLGLQAITEVFGGKLENLDSVFHGVATTMRVTDEQAIVFKGLPAEFEAARYHSWIASRVDFPEELNITSLDDSGNIMSFEHQTYPLSAVQFHPESILTPLGADMLRNFIHNYQA